VVAVLVGLFAVAACRAPVRPYVCAPEAEVENADPHEAWRCNIDVLRRAARGKEFTLREFERARAFFRELTELDVASREIPLGSLPAPGLKDDIRTLGAWYEANGERLRWDARRGRPILARDGQED